MKKKKNEKKVDPNTLFWWTESSVKGTLVYELMVPCNPQPVCSVWTRWIGNATIEILNSYTIEPFRRRGYRTHLHNELIKFQPKAKWITTARAGSKEAKAWLKKMGFWQDEITGDFMLEINRKKIR